jgi:hypothetical protein
MTFLGGKERYLQKLSYGFETLDMTSDGLGEMFEGDPWDGTFPLMSMRSLSGGSSV